jgi:hypothetical protein
MLYEKKPEQTITLLYHIHTVSRWISKAICRDLFMFHGFSREVIIRFVDIGVIVDHHC